MTFLFIDTSTERSLIVWASNSKIIYKKELPFGMQSSQHLLPFLEEGRLLSHIDYKSIKKIGVGIGPGSYTGIRVGVAVAKGLAYSHSLPLVGICSLDAFIPEEDAYFASMIDARVGGVFVQTGRRLNDKIIFEKKAALLSIEQASEVAKSVDCVITPSKKPLEKRFEAPFIESSLNAEYLMQIMTTATVCEEWEHRKNLPLLYLREWSPT